MRSIIHVWLALDWKGKQYYNADKYNIRGGTRINGEKSAGMAE